jgi:hypothetical protein
MAKGMFRNPWKNGETSIRRKVHNLFSFKCNTNSYSILTVAMLSSFVAVSL